jgi:transketolase
MDNKINVKLLSMAGQGGSAFGITLMELMKERDDIMVLSADMSTPAGLDKFKATYPDHFMNVGVAEQNMIGIAAGLANEGFRVICVAQACFITMRCFEQIRQYAGYMDIPLILVGIGSGLSLQYMGNTHYALEDISLMRTIPNMTVMAPCDSLEAMKVLECAVNSNDSTYIRFFGGTNIPVVHQSDIVYAINKPITLRVGKDVSILAYGTMVKQALQVADALSNQGIECDVIDVLIIMPFDDTILDLFNDKKLVVTIEEHRPTGGLASIVSKGMKMKRISTKLLNISVETNYPIPGSYSYLLDQCGLSVDKIFSSIINNIK